MSGSGIPKRASFLELFFDLVFVFAVTQLAAMLRADHTLGGWGRAGLMAWLVWWAWSQYTWAGNAIDLNRRGGRAAILAATAATLLVATAIPEAYGATGAWFAVPYALVRLACLALYGLGPRHDPDHCTGLRAYLPVAVVPPAVVLAGGFAAPQARPWI
ncbi:MAG: low temperature requirement protein A [Acidimicrobiia bacterium]|nr:low temperature requirement protein A [Acidimicrobiia bacterium]